ncbi:hypothetical protein [Xylanimonas cellulosilytica]|uniref:hypothetical protein n=1 Tax=Xylanimonas cellulosilytica TaxID=186189 RepID=UPI0011D098B0|nr:hypothetical protein [Xylanimonas cellulosilytica]
MDSAGQQTWLGDLDIFQGGAHPDEITVFDMSQPEATRTLGKLSAAWTFASPPAFSPWIVHARSKEAFARVTETLQARPPGAPFNDLLCDLIPVGDVPLTVVTLGALQGRPVRFVTTRVVTEYGQVVPQVLAGRLERLGVRADASEVEPVPFEAMCVRYNDGVDSWLEQVLDLEDFEPPEARTIKDLSWIYVEFPPDLDYQNTTFMRRVAAVIPQGRRDWQYEVYGLSAKDTQ